MVGEARFVGGVFVSGLALGRFVVGGIAYAFIHRRWAVLPFASVHNSSHECRSVVCFRLEVTSFRGCEAYRENPSNLSTTQRYAEVEGSRLLAAFDAAHPRA